MQQARKETKTIRAAQKQGEEFNPEVLTIYLTVSTRYDTKGHETIMDPRNRTSNPGLAARLNLETLKDLLKSTPGGTPETLETAEPTSAMTEQQESDSIQDLDISTEIEELLHFVDKFQFRSPLAVTRNKRTSPDPPQSARSVQHMSQSLVKNPPTMQTPQTAPVGRRLPLTETTNSSFLVDFEATKSNLHDTLLSKEERKHRQQLSSRSSPLEDPEGLLLFDDGSEMESLSKQEEDDEVEALPVVTENDWEKFNQLVRKVENALLEAKTEKDATRLWAREVRETTESWVKAQRDLIDREKNTFFGEAADADEDRNENQSTTSMAFYEARIERLENSIRGLELDLRTTELHHQTNEKRLLGIIQYQQETLRKLQELKGVKPEESSRKLNVVSTPFPGHRLAEQPSNVLRTQSFETHVDEFATIAQKELYFTEDKTNTGLLRCGAHSLHHHKPFLHATPAVIQTAQARPSARSTGHRSITLPTGAEHITRPDGSSSIRYPNGDVQISSPNNANRTVAFYHADSKVIQVVAKDGSEIFEFPNKQVERHYPDGRKIVKWPDGTKKRFFPNGTVETFLPCGRFIVEHPDGTRDDVRRLLV